MSANIRTEMSAGKPQKQAVAIAYKQAGKPTGLKAAQASHPNASRLGAFLHPKKGK